MVDTEEMKVSAKKIKPKRKPVKIEPLQIVKPLNGAEKDSMASIFVKIRGSIANDPDFWDDNYRIKITDCDRSIILHGKLRDPKSRANALFKIGALIETLTEAKEHIEKELKSKRLTT